MIDPNWILEDLDPATWRAIGRFFMPAQYIATARPGEHGLFVLHDAGHQPRAVDTRHGLRDDLHIQSIGDPARLAAELYARGHWQRVHVIDRRHLQHVARTAQAEPRRALSIDAYYHLVYQLLWDGSAGYVSVPPHPGSAYGLTYAGVQRFLSTLPSPAGLGLCVVADAGDALEIGLIVRIDHGRVTRVTTLEGLPPLPVPSLTQTFLEAFCQAIDQTIAPAAHVVVCTHAAYEGWLAATDKRAALGAAVQAGTARWRR